MGYFVFMSMCQNGLWGTCLNHKNKQYYKFCSSYFAVNDEYNKYEKN